MVNANKNKGDKGERDAVEFLVALCPDLVVRNPRRMLGAGRKDDEGDLRVFPDAAVQVKVFKPQYLSKAMYDAAVTSVDQAKNAEQPYALGMVKMHNARGPHQKWLASVVEWPEDLTAPPVEHKAATAAAEWAKKHPAPDAAVGIVTRAGSPTIYVAPLGTWVAAYRRARLATAA
ncbi:hypothetical protein [Leifsonia sp. Leaf264]|uniref:hypothetical protein n=1 Tax=Leifsonia sp. Leaf264 TaxID=1736314 RepID=UPI0007014DCD|nr:hypothetical protein [Leifsonia sp. Leaf264]KQO98866.1 hypothetical protein ASF30_12450 [Leifsonia sp. Leaf264]